MTTENIYTSMLQPRGNAYRENQVVAWSHYDDPIDHSAGRAAGNSRIWGDASPEAQSHVIDALIASSERAGLNPRETAYVLAIARAESGFNLDAAAGTTSATGLGQFIDQTGATYGINDGNRGDLRMQADALVAHYQENAAAARQRGQGEAYIYKYHHDGPTEEHGGLALSEKLVMPYLDRYEAFVREHEQKYGIAPRGPSLATHSSHATASSGIEQGAHGSAVATLQADLARLGYTDHRGQPLAADGTFGLDTRHAVERFQRDHHLTVDGKVGPQTEHALHATLHEHAKQAAVPPGLDDPRNPNHALYEQALTGVRALDAHMGRPTDQQSLNLAAALTVEAKREGLTHIDRVLLNDDASRTFAMQDRASLLDPLKFASVDTMAAVNTPSTHSSSLAASIQPPAPVQAPAPAQTQATTLVQAPPLVM